MKTNSRFYLKKNKLIVFNNNEIKDVFEINKLESINIVQIFSKLYNILCSIVFFIGVCFLILEEYYLFFIFAFFPFLILYFFLNQKKIFISFRYQNQQFRYLISEDEIPFVDDFLETVFSKKQFTNP